VSAPRDGSGGKSGARRGGRLAHLARYALAGAVTIATYMTIYNLLVMAGLMRFLASTLAYGGALLVQFFAHGRYTFGHRDAGHGVVWRYLVSVGFGLLMAAGISQANTKLYSLDDRLVSAIVMGLVAISNFVLFNLWVYRGRPAPPT
jgi:putative flippase GtrA